jgi:hypothetical protein
MDLETRTLYAEVVLGQDVDEFFKSDIGRYVIGRSLEVVQECTEKLKTVRPDYKNKVKDLQNRIFQAEAALKWLNEALIIGRESLEQLNEMED